MSANNRRPRGATPSLRGGVMSRKLRNAFVAALLATFCAGVWASELTFGCGAVGQEFELCKSLADEWAKKTGNTVRTHGVSRNASERLGIFLQAFEMKSDFFDVIQVDVVWPGMLAPHLLDLTPYAKGAEREFFP